MGKTLLVIGGSSDIGLAVVNDLVESYDRIIIHYNHMNDELERLDEAYDKIECLQADLSDLVSTQNFISLLAEKSVVPSHILHLPASKIEIRRFHKTSWDIIEQEIDISLRSIVMILGKLLPLMCKNSYGKIVIMLSMVINGMPPKYNADYVIVKEALYGLVKSLAVEYADKGITINGISPSLVETKFLDNMHSFMIEENAKMSPIGRNLKVSELLPTIRFLLSEDSDFISGQNISITCGR